MKLSIITVNLNNKKGLEKTFDSIFKQTFQDFEYLVIDGGSTDGSLELIKSFSTKINFWMSEKDSGVYNAMNKGIKNATGEYINFMNSGDCFYEDTTIEKAVTHFNQDIAVLCGDTKSYKKELFVANLFAPKAISFGYFFKGGLYHQSAFIKKDLFYKCFFYNENYKICSDWELFIYALCLKNETYQKLNIFICKYDLGGISADSKFIELHQQERRQVLNKYFAVFVNDYTEYEKIERFYNKKIVKKSSIILQTKVPKVFYKLITAVIYFFTIKPKSKK
ncbi:MAG: glycosyltransferase [Ferruginibacter sp.]|nr:glycosyltransferase [Ferruginibacter sp.]NOU38841.1 glycosyltransferase [Ferruginibacter sp.]